MKPEKFSIYVDDSNREEIKRIAYENGIEGIMEFDGTGLYYFNRDHFVSALFDIPKDVPTITLDQFREYYDGLPEKWAVKYGWQKELDEWIKTRPDFDKDFLPIRGYIVKSKNDKSYQHWGDAYGNKISGYVIITFDKWKRLVYDVEFGKKKIKGYKARNEKFFKAWMSIKWPNLKDPTGFTSCAIDFLENDSEVEKELEIMHWFNPIYEEEEKVFYIGDQKKEVKVSRGNVIFGDEKLNISSFELIVAYPKMPYFNVELNDATLTINGVTGITLSEIKQIIQEYNKLNK